MPVRADAIANRDQVGVAVDVERQMLHRARRDVLCSVPGVRDALDWLNRRDLGMLHECDRRAVAHFHEAVEGVVDAMHPVERDQLHPDDLREVVDLLFDVLGTDSEVMDSIGQTHDADLRSKYSCCATM